MNTDAHTIENEFLEAGVEIKLTEAEKNALELRKLGAGRDNAQKQWNGRVYKFWNSKGGTPSNNAKSNKREEKSYRKRRIARLEEALERKLIDEAHQHIVHDMINSLKTRHWMDPRQKQIYQFIKLAVKKARRKEYLANRTITK